jgi:hypothetical protein
VATVYADGFGAFELDQSFWYLDAATRMPSDAEAEMAIVPAVNDPAAPAGVKLPIMAGLLYA